MTPEPARDAADVTPRAAPRHRGAGQFVLVFVVITVALLTGYHFAAGTEANTRYLTFVARHTAVLLDVVGEYARVSATEQGPRVVFLLEPGVAARRDAARIEVAEAGAAASDADRAALEALEVEYTQIRDTIGGAAARNDKRFVFIIVPECGAIEVMVIFLAGVVAFPARWRARLLGLAAGLPVLYGVNLLRLAALAVVGAVDEGGQWFEFCHRYVWQSVYIVFVVVAWMAWVEFVVRRGKSAPAGQAGS